MEWESPTEGMRFKQYVHHSQKIRLLEFTDAFVEEDWCLNGHTGYVLEGRLEVVFQGDISIFEQGMGLMIPEGEAHKHKASVRKGEKALLILFEISRLKN